MTYTSVTAAHLISQGSCCSLCGQLFDNYNTPTITKLTSERFGEVEVDKALCTHPKILKRHVDAATDDVLFTIYQSATVTTTNPYGVLEILYQDIDPA